MADFETRDDESEDGSEMVEYGRPSLYEVMAEEERLDENHMLRAQIKSLELDSHLQQQRMEQLEEENTRLCQRVNTLQLEIQRRNFQKEDRPEHIRIMLKHIETLTEAKNKAQQEAKDAACLIEREKRAAMEEHNELCSLAGTSTGGRMNMESMRDDFRNVLARLGERFEKRPQNWILGAEESLGKRSRRW